jgi:hypothetical protein
LGARLGTCPALVAVACGLFVSGGPAPAAASAPVCPPAEGTSSPAIADPANPPADALIACVGGDAVTGALFSHWHALALKGDASTDAKALRGVVMDFLLSAGWTTGEARERGIRVSARAVRRRFTSQKHANFRTQAAFLKFLGETGETVSDIEFRVRLDMLSERIRKDAEGTGTARSKHHAFAIFIRRFPAKWKARTSCRPEYTVTGCGSTLQ